MKPTACLQDRRTPRPVMFAGEAISLSKISRHTGVNVSLLSKIFSGRRQPTLDSARRIAVALGMRLDEFLEAVDNIELKIK